MTGAFRRAGLFAEIEAACRAYYRLDDATKDGGEFAMGAHRLLERDRWRDFLGTGSAAGVALDQWPETRWKAALGVFDDDGTWDATWGPKPGEPGCRAPPSLLVRGVA